MGKILFAEKSGIHVLKFVGDVRLTLGPTISTFLEQLRSCSDFRSMIIDLTDTETIDSTALGLIAKISICTQESFNRTTTIVSPRGDVTRVLNSMAMEQVCVISHDQISDEPGLRELPQEIASEDVLREQVLEAHKVLMSLTSENYEKFQDLVEALESEKPLEPTQTARTG